jgi:Meiotically up-regulated gene 113
LKDLKKKGFAVNPTVGYWRIHAVDSSPAASDQRNTSANLPREEIVDYPMQPESAEVRPVIDLEIGEGSGAIYVYYLPTYRQQVEQRGEDVWPCKIGRTDRDPLERILAQAAMALPERPRIALVLRTSMPLAWEAALHNVLTIRGLKIKDIPGSEWFLTSPDAIYR